MLCKISLSDKVVPIPFTIVLAVRPLIDKVDAPVFLVFALKRTIIPST